MLALRFHRRVMDDLSDLPPKHFRQVTLKIFDLMKNPQPSDSIEVKGKVGVYRVTSGEYRIAYRFDEATLFIYIVGKRNDDAVYKGLEGRV